MNSSRLWAAATIIAIIILASFIFLVPHTHEVPLTRSPETTTALMPEVRLSDSFKKGVHTITGTVRAPDACASITATATLAGNASSTERIVVALSMPDTTGVCLKRVAILPFTTSIEAPAHLPIDVSVNERVATTTP